MLVPMHAKDRDIGLLVLRVSSRDVNLLENLKFVESFSFDAPCHNQTLSLSFSSETCYFGPRLRHTVSVAKNIFACLKN